MRATARFKPLLDKVAGALTVGLLGAHQAHRPQAHGEFRRRADAQDRPAVQGASPRPRTICAPRFRKNPTPRSKPFSAASGTISAASPSSSPISTNSASTVSARRRRTSSPIRRNRKERYDAIMKSGKATISFAAHLANWELPGVGAQIDRRQIRRSVPAAEYRRRQRRDHQTARTADGRIDPDRPRRAGEAGAACCNPASMSACSPTSITARRRGDVLRPDLPRQSADRDARPPDRTADLRHARRAQARRQQLLGRSLRPQVEPVLRRRRPSRHQRHHAGDHRR